jgi:hydrogenase maturation protease
MEANILLLGLGNVLLGDEGLGIRAWERLQEQYHLPEEVNCVDGGVLGLELLAYVDGVTHLLAIDAVQTGQPPGTLVRLEGEEIPKTLALKLSMHQVSFQEVLAMSYLQGTTPPRLVIWGMEPAVLETGVILSDVVEAQLDHLVQEVVGELRQWGIEIVPIPYKV